MVRPEPPVIWLGVVPRLAFNEAVVVTTGLVAPSKGLGPLARRLAVHRHGALLPRQGGLLAK